MVNLLPLLPYMILPITSGAIQLLNNRNAGQIASDQYQRQLELQRRRQQEQIELLSLQREGRLEESERLARLQQEIRREEALYPLRGGPGIFRQNLLSIYGNTSAIPPVVLIQPPNDETKERLWDSARVQAQNDLGDLHYEHLIHMATGLPHRHFDWPDAAFYHADLRDIPTIVVQLFAGADQLHIWIGGCHLIPNGPPIVRPVHALSIHYRREDQWDEEIIRAVNAQRADTRLLAVPTGGKLSPQAANRLMNTLASLAIRLCVVRVMDTYHLMHDHHYDERFEDVVRQAIPGFDTVPAVPVPTEWVRDPVYHLLGQAERHLRGGQVPNAGQAAEQALRQMLGADGASTVPLAELMPRVAKARRVLLAFPEDHPLRERFLPLLERVQAAAPPPQSDGYSRSDGYDPTRHPFG